MAETLSGFTPAMGSPRIRLQSDQRLPGEFRGMARGAEAVDYFVQGVVAPALAVIRQDANLELSFGGLAQTQDLTATAGSLRHQQAFLFELQQGGVDGVAPDSEVPGQAIPARHEFTPHPLRDFATKAGGDLFGSIGDPQRTH